MLRRLLSTGAVVSASVVATASASAADRASSSEVAAADALFREARLAAKRGDYATACPKFRESHRLDATVGATLNVADCDEHEGQFLRGLARFQEALVRLGATDDRRTYVQSRIVALRERIPRVEVRSPGVHAFVD